MIFRLLSQRTSLGEATNCLIDAPLENIPDRKYSRLPIKPVTWLDL